MEITEILFFTEILVKFVKSIFGSELLVEFIFDLKMIIFGSFDPKWSKMSIFCPKNVFFEVYLHVKIIFDTSSCYQMLPVIWNYQ